MDITNIDSALFQIVMVIAGAVIILSIIVVIAKKIAKSKKERRHIQFVQCYNCNWKGKVSRYAGRCPKCNEPLGDQIARK
jgi:predicted Zn-ribbon and HTH transcriptional regulator